MTRLNRPKLIPSPPPTAIRPVDPKFKIRLLCAHYLSVEKLGHRAMRHVGQLPGGVAVPPAGRGASKVTGAPVSLK